MTLKIFVADDSVTIQRIVSLAFSAEDALIDAATDGEAALDAIRALRPDIVLADVCMPGRNGYELCAAVKQDPNLAGTPVVLLVGAFEPYDEAEAARVRSDGRLTKPFDTEELIQTVHALAAGGGAGTDVEEKTGAAEEEQTAQGGPRFARGFATERMWNSFTGPGRILDLLDVEDRPWAGAAPEAARETVSGGSAPKAEGRRGQDAGSAPIPEDVLDAIVDRVVRRMSADVVREVAWEVVPELSEIIIRRTLEEQKKS